MEVLSREGDGSVRVTIDGKIQRLTKQQYDEATRAEIEVGPQQPGGFASTLPQDSTPTQTVNDQRVQMPVQAQEGTASGLSEQPEEIDFDNIRSPQGYSSVTIEDMAESSGQYNPMEAPAGYASQPRDFGIKLERALKYSDNPSRDWDKANAAVMIADRVGADAQSVFNNFDAYTEQYFGQKVLPSKAWTLIQDDFKRSLGTLRLGHAGTSLMLSSIGGEPDLDAFNEMVHLMESLPPVSDQERKFLSKAMGDIAAFSTSMGATMAAGLTTAQLGKFFGGKGAAIGFMIGSATEAFVLAAGNIYADIAMMEDPATGKPMYQALMERSDNFKWNPETQKMEQIYDKDEAMKTFLRTSAAFASGGGLISALIEVPQIDAMVGGKLLNDIVGKHLSEMATKALSSKVIFNSASRFFVNHGLNVVEESLQEALQESVEWWSTELAQRNIAADLQMQGVPQGTIDEWMKHVGNVLASTSRATMFLGLPGSVSMSGFQAVQDKRAAREKGDLSFNSTPEDVFVRASEIDRPGVNTRETVIDPQKRQEPINVQEKETGGYEVLPEDEARLGAMETTGAADVAVSVTPYSPKISENATPDVIAAENDWKYIEGQILVNARKTLNTLVTQNPKSFAYNEEGNVEYTHPETGVITQVKSKSDYLFEESGLKDRVSEIENRIEELEPEYREQAAEFVEKARDAANSDDYVGAFQSLQNDPILEHLNMVWFADGGMDAGFDRFADLSDQMAPDEKVDEAAIPDAIDPVFPYEDVAERRAEYDSLAAEYGKFSELTAKTDNVLAEMERIKGEMAALAPFIETPHEAATRSALEGGHFVPDSILNQYEDRPWAEDEIAHRKVLKASEFIYDDARSYYGRTDEFRDYIMSDFYWYGNEEGRQVFLDSLPDDPEAISHFLSDLIDKSYFRTERTLEEWVESINTDAGLESWLGKIDRMDLFHGGFSPQINKLISKADRGQAITATELSVVRAQINKRPEHYQRVFYSHAAQSDPDIAYYLAAQKDYEYIMSLEAARRENSVEADLEAVLEDVRADGTRLSLQLEKERKIVFLGQIIVPEDMRGKGVATAAMNEVTAFADRHGLQVQLSPSKAWGSDEARLTDFYKRFGFVENKGETYSNQISNTMYRQPETAVKAEQAPITEKSVPEIEKSLTKVQIKIKSLRDALKSARQEASLAARKAEATGKAKATEKALAKYNKDITSLKEQLKERMDRERRLRKERERILRMVKQIKRPPGKGINVRIRDKIQVLQGLLDDHFTTKANVTAWEQEFKTIVETYNDQGLESLVTKYGMSPRPLNLWSIEELSALNAYINNLRRAGRTFQETKDSQQRARYRSVRRYMIDEMLQDAKPLPPSGSVAYKKAVRSGLLTERFWTLRPSRIFRMLDNWAEGQFYHFFVSETNKLEDQAIFATKRRRVLGAQKMEDLGLTIHDLAKEEIINGVPYTKDAMLHVWMGMQNEKSRRAILYGNKISEDEALIMSEKLSENEKAWGEWMMEEFTENFPRMEKVYEDYMNDHLKQEDAYFPMIRLGSSWEVQDQDFWDQFKLRNEYTKSAVDRSATYERVDNKNKNQGAIALGATHIWMEQVEKHEHWVHMGMHVRDMNNIIHRDMTDNTKVKTLFESKWGTQGYKFLEKYIEDVANPTLFKGHDGVSLASRRLRKNTAIGYLAWNALTMLKQAPSLALFLRDAGPQHIIAAAAQYMTNHAEMKKFIDDHDAQMWSRVMTKELELLKQREKKGVFRAVDAVGAAGMLGIQKIDSAVTHIGWLAVYNKNKHLGVAEATRKAQMAVLETQPSARAKDLAQMYRSGEVLNWFTMFSNQLNNIWSMTTSDTVYAFKNKEYDRLIGTVVGVGISVFSMMLLSGYRPGEDDDETAKELIKQITNFIPLVGKNISGGIEGWMDGGVNPLPITGEFGRLIGEGLDLDAEGIGKALLSLGKAGGVAFGIPVTGLVNRPADIAEAMIEDGAQGKDLLEIFGQAYVGGDK